MTGSDGMAPDDALVAFLRAHPATVDQLLVAHVDDGRGQCRACTGATGRGRQAHPCTIRSAADKAAR